MCWATCTRFSPGCSSSLAKVRVNTELGLSSLFDSRSSAVWRGPAENTENTPSGSCVIGASPPPPATRAGARALERIVAAGIEHQDRGAHLLVLQPLDDAVGEHRGVAHQFFLALARRRHIGRQQEILAGDFKAVAGIEEERGIAGLHRVVERQQGLAESLPGLVLRHHHGKAELLERVAHGAGVVDRLLQLGHVLVIVVADHQRDALFRLRRRGSRQQRQPRGVSASAAWKANSSSNSPP